MRRVYFYISSRIRAWFLLLILLVPMVLALPTPISWKPFHYHKIPVKIQLNNGSPAERTEFPVPTKVNTFGRSIFSSLLSIETDSMPTYVCATNNSEVIYNGHIYVESNVFLNGGGLADLYLNINQDSKDSSMKIPLASSTCSFTTAKISSGIGNEITWGVRPTPQLENIIFKVDSEVGFKFNWWTYFRNSLLSTGAWVIILASFIQVLQYLKKNDNLNVSSMDAIDKKILKYLTEKDIASEAAVINETFVGFGITKEEYVKKLEALQNQDLVRYERPYGNGAFVYITENGRLALKPLGKRIWSYVLANHLIEIITLLVAVLTLIYTL